MLTFTYSVKCICTYVGKSIVDTYTHIKDSFYIKQSFINVLFLVIKNCFKIHAVSLYSLSGR